MTFAQKGLGDVLLAWENEAFLALDEFGADNFDIVYPSSSILAEPPVAIVDGNVDAKGTRKVAEEYLKYLYSKEAQTIIARNHYRPYKPDLVDSADLAWEKDIKLVTIDDPQFGVAPGQACVVYRESRVLGGGWIRREAAGAQTATAA